MQCGTASLHVSYSLTNRGNAVPRVVGTPSAQSLAQCAMEALDFALRLGMSHSAEIRRMPYSRNTPSAPGWWGLSCSTTMSCFAIDQHAGGHAVPLETARQHRTDEIGARVTPAAPSSWHHKSTGHDRGRRARDSAAVAEWIRPLRIHLPQVIRRGTGNDAAPALAQHPDASSPHAG